MNAPLTRLLNNKRENRRIVKRIKDKRDSEILTVDFTLKGLMVEQSLGVYRVFKILNPSFYTGPGILRVKSIFSRLKTLSLQPRDAPLL